MPEERDQENLVECPECEGSGVIKVGVASMEAMDVERDEVCEFCQGEGWVLKSMAEARKRMIDLVERREDRRRLNE